MYVQLRPAPIQQGTCPRLLQPLCSLEQPRIWAWGSQGQAPGYPVICVCLPDVLSYLEDVLSLIPLLSFLPPWEMALQILAIEGKGLIIASDAV